MKLIYWQATPVSEPGYMTLRAKTKKQLLKDMESSWVKFDKPEKVVLEYESGFELLDCCLSEKGYQYLQIN